jgi:hypothetical protein
MPIAHEVLEASDRKTVSIRIDTESYEVLCAMADRRGMDLTDWASIAVTCLEAAANTRSEFLDLVVEQRRLLKRQRDGRLARNARSFNTVMLLSERELAASNK